MTDEDSEKNLIQSNSSSKSNLLTKKLLDKENEIDKTSSITAMMATTNDLNEQITAAISPSAAPLSNVDINVNGDETKQNSTKSCDDNNFYNNNNNNDDENETKQINDQNIDPSEEIGDKIINNDDDHKMDNDLPKDEVENDPNFAIICSFMEKFGHHLDLKYSIKHLKTIFEDYNKVRPDLIDLHIKLLRKRRKYINKEKWEKALMRFCAEYSNIDAWNLEQFGYNNADLSLRLRIFLRLLEAMFDFNQKFKSELNSTMETSSLRIPAIGRDLIGYTYWYQLDSDLNFRLYKDEPDEDNSWSLVSKNLTELNDCIQDLEKQSIDDFKQMSTPASEESISNPASCQIPAKIINDQDDDEKDEKINQKQQFDHDDDEQEKPATPPSVKIEEQQSDEQQLPSSPAKLVIKTENIDYDKPIDGQNESKNHNDVQSENFISTNDKEIESICESILDKIEKENNDYEDDGDDDDDEQQQQHETTKSSNRGGYRGGGRRRRGKRRGGRWSNNRRKTTATTSTIKDEDEKMDIETVNNKENSNELQQNNDDNNVDEESKPVVVKKQAGRKRRNELDKLKEDFAEGLQAKRCSRRIQALHEKKLIEMEEEQKRMEKELLEKRRKKEAAMAAKAAALLAAQFACDKSNDPNEDDDSDNSNDSDDDDDEDQSRQSKKRGRRKKKATSDDDYQKESGDDEKKKKKRKRRKKGGRKGATPWEDESDDSDEKRAEHTFDDDYYEDYMHDDDDEQLRFDDNKIKEDEFACEEIDPEDEPVVIRRARTVKKSKDDCNDNVEFLENYVNDDKPCGKCGKYDNPHWILLCDKCDDGYHTSCLRPPLFLIPTGEWFCPPCEHKFLIEKLRVEYQRLTEEIEQRAIEKQKLRKRWRYGHCEISADNILEEGEQINLGENGGELVIDQDQQQQYDDGGDDDIEKKKAKAQHRKGVRRRRPNGYARSDEIADLLYSNDEDSRGFIDNDNDGDDNGREKGKKTNRIANRKRKYREYSDSDDDSSGEDEEDSEVDDFISDSEDEVAKCIDKYDDEDEYRHREKKKKHRHREKHIDINDFSRSGLKLRSARKRKPISYLFKEYDNLIKSAILQEEDEAEGYDYGDGDGDAGSDDATYPRSKGKDINNILEQADTEMPDFSINPFEKDTTDSGHHDDDIKSESNINDTKDSTVVKPISDKASKDNDDDDDDEITEQRKKSNANRKQQKKKKSLTNLDFSDEDDDEDHASDEDFNMADDDEMDEELTEVDDDDNQETELSESDSEPSSRRRRSSRIQRNYSFKSDRKRKKSHNKKKRIQKKSGRRFLIDDSEDEEENDNDLTSEEDDDDDELSNSGSYSDQSSDYAPRTRRAAQKSKRISYREDSSTADDDDEYGAIDDLPPTTTTTKKKDKYQEDEDYNDEDDDDDEINLKASNKSVPKLTATTITPTEPNPKLKPNIQTYSRECRDENLVNNKRKKQLIISDDDNDDVDENDGDKHHQHEISEEDVSNKTTKKTKIDDNQSQPPLTSVVDNDDGQNKSNNKDETAIVEKESKFSTASSIDSNQPSIAQIVPPETMTTPIIPIKTDPLVSIQKMNSKFAIDVNPSVQPKSSSIPSSSGTPEPPTSVPISYSHPQQHYQQQPPPIRPTYHQSVAANTPVSGHYVPPPPVYPSQVPSSHEYPSPPQQYLARPPPPQSYQYPPHPQSSIRSNLPPPHPHAHQYYSPSSSIRYPSVVSTASPGRLGGDGKDDPNYTLTNLDSYSGPAPPKTQSYLPQNYPSRPPPNFVPVSSAAAAPVGQPQTSPNRSPPPKILNLDSPRNPYPTNKHQPGPPPPTHHYYQPGHHAYDHNLIPPHSHPDYYQSHHHVRPQGGPPPPPPHGYYGGPIHPHGPPLQRMPPHVGPPYPQQGPPPPSLHYMSPRNVSPRQQTPSPSSLVYPPQAPNSNNLPQSSASTSSPTAIRPPYPSSGPYPYPGQPHGYPPHPAPYPHPHHPPYSVAASNGGFMIQNLLHNPPPAVPTLPIPATMAMTNTTASATKPVCAIKSSPKASKSSAKAKKSSTVAAIDSALIPPTSAKQIPSKVTKSRKKSNDTKKIDTASS
ncbi:LOW QUALITY PROTEIN: uncharacterized protein LOC113793915 [Dermatophagoides pteronyssinus]|uniref:LOW QUALITY PROTEIN: uncharacterized protein LOC113793915 n=1 Tax=Dermatophagoides pteronyssinus TaxID=6956 RepID=UPI003F6807F8